MKPHALRQGSSFAAIGAALIVSAAAQKTITDESLVPPYTLPDPLVCSDGQKVDSPESWWKKRRPELLAMFENEMYGRTPFGRLEGQRFVVREEKRDARGGLATRLRVAVLFEGTEEGRQMELLIYLPNHVKGPVPVFLGLNFDGNYTTTSEPDLPVPTHWAMGLFQNKLQNHQPTAAGRGLHQHMWPYAYALEHGYGVATAAYGEIEPDAPEAWKTGPRGLGPDPGEEWWGSVGAWAWGLSRAMDYLETNPRVDAGKVGVVGFSRLGKTALWAGVQDQRFAMVVSHGSGGGGAALSKRIFGETVRNLTAGVGRWLSKRFAKYADNEEALPFDQHELLGLIAPRPVLITSGSTDLWADPKGEFLSGLGASPVYRLLGKEGMLASEWPAESVLSDGTVGYFLRPGAHDVTLEDWQALIRFADKHWGSKP